MITSRGIVKFSNSDAGTGNGCTGKRQEGKLKVWTRGNDK